MKRSVLLLLICSNFVTAFSQSSNISLKAVTDSFVNKYFSLPDKGIAFEKLDIVFKSFFRLDNRLLVDTYEKLRKAYKVQGDSASQMLVDTILHNFLREHLWDGQEELKVKSNDYLKYYADKVCKCIQVQGVKSHRETGDMIANCIASLNKDPEVYVRAKDFGSKVTPDELAYVSRITALVLIKECDQLYKYFTYIMYTETGSSLMLDHETVLREKDIEVAELYKKKSNQLQVIFPDYKKFEPAIAKAAAMPVGTDIYEETRIMTINEFRVFRVYYTYKNGKAVLLGEVEFTLKDESIYAPVTFFQFTAPEKIKDRAFMIKRLNESYVEPPPALPPPMIEMQKVKN